MRLSALFVAALAGCAAAPRLERPLTFERGVAVGLFGGDERDTAARLSEVARLGATDVSLVVTWAVDGLHASEVIDDPQLALSDDALRSAIRQAHAAGLRVMLFPLIRLVHRTAAEWRGRLDPGDPARWFVSYRTRVERLARLAAVEQVEALCVGSELASLERRADDWLALIRAVRNLYRGALVYSANWDRFQEVPFWRELDRVGVSAYWELTAGGHRPTVGEALRSWQPLRARLAAFARAIGRPLVLTEVGYPSMRGAGAWPWNDFLDGEEGREDAEAQRRLYESFTLAWNDEPALAGSYFWIWTAPGGVGDRGYTPRGKPAADEVRSWYRQVPLVPLR